MHLGRTFHVPRWQEAGEITVSWAAPDRISPDRQHRSRKAASRGRHPSKHGASIGAERSRPIQVPLPVKVQLSAMWYMLAAPGVR